MTTILSFSIVLPGYSLVKGFLTDHSLYTRNFSTALSPAHVDDHVVT